MTRDDSEWVNGLFAANAADRTPAPASHAARVLYAPVSRDPEASRRCASVLSDIELQRAERIVTEDGKAHFKQRRAFRRYCGAFVLGSPQPLSRIVFQETEKGRPYLPDFPNVRFSFSSCRFGFLGAWSSTHGIGVDLEDQTRNLEAVELAQQFFSQAEVKAVKVARRFGAPANFLPTLEPQGSSSEIDWRGIALRSRRVRVRINSNSTCRSRAT